MANVLAELFADIADSIRSKTGDTATMKPAEFPEKISGISGTSEDVRYVTFCNEDGTVEYGKKAVAVGDDCADPIARGIFGTPTKESTAQYNYTFSGGWATTPNGGSDSTALKAVTADKTVYATFIAAVRYYTITFYDSDGTTVLKTARYAYGTTPSYTPSKDDYAFMGWDRELEPVTGDASYVAQFVESVAFADASWTTIAQIAESGMASKMFALGDTKEFTFTGLHTGEIITMNCVINGFDHDDLADGSGKAGISVTTEMIGNSRYPFDSDGGDQDATAWPRSTLRTALNSEVFSSMDSELKSVIKSVKKKTKHYSPASGGVIEETSNDKIWLLSIGEISGTLSSTSNFCSGDGEQYAYFNKKPLQQGSTSSIPYLVRSGVTKSSSTPIVYYHPNYGGGTYRQTGSSGYQEMIFGFCI